MDKKKHPKFTRDVRNASRQIRKTGRVSIGFGNPKYEARVEKRAYKKTAPYVTRKRRRELRRQGKQHSDTFQKGFDSVTPMPRNRYTRDLLDVPTKKKRKKSVSHAFDAGRQFSPAQTEDSIGYWDGKKRGNKRGKSYTTDSKGKTTYIKAHRKRHRPKKQGYNPILQKGMYATAPYGDEATGSGKPRHTKYVSGKLKSKRKKAAVNRIRQRSSSGKRIV